MEVELRHGLAGDGAIIQAEVESVGLRVQLGGQVLLGPVNPDEEAGLLRTGQLLESGDGPAGNNQRVTWGDWEFVGDNREEVVHGEKAGALDLAEGR